MNTSIIPLLIIAGSVFSTASSVWSEDIIPPPPQVARAADVVFIGEQHDNPGHHQLQARWVEALEPRALVFEMLTPLQAEAVTEDNRQDEAALKSALAWETSGWPDFAMYYPVFEAAPLARIYGAGVPRDEVRNLMTAPLGAAFGAEDAIRFGIDKALSEVEQMQREQIQRIAHCDALPEEILPTMVSIQRLRDAVLARASSKALSQTGGPVVVITGNGHARTDWGAPFLLAFSDPDIEIFSLGQGEAETDPDGVFDTIVDGPSVDRGNPCDAFN
ncbi:ChaN family lipoprotein [Roseobacter sp. EG26]|uniref:ChaN family lipoprotein n=1 Tax=Roseobacter sp. EG26 TaxID=3412477 RepID=UPI003CE54EE0